MAGIVIFEEDVRADIEKVLDGTYNFAAAELEDLVALRHDAMQIHKHSRLCEKPVIWNAIVEIEDALAFKTAA